MFARFQSLSQHPENRGTVDDILGLYEVKSRLHRFEKPDSAHLIQARRLNPPPSHNSTQRDPLASPFRGTDTLTESILASTSTNDSPRKLLFESQRPSFDSSPQSLFKSTPTYTGSPLNLSQFSTPLAQTQLTTNTFSSTATLSESNRLFRSAQYSKMVDSRKQENREKAKRYSGVTGTEDGPPFVYHFPVCGELMANIITDDARVQMQKEDYESTAMSQIWEEEREVFLKEWQEETRKRTFMMIEKQGRAEREKEERRALRKEEQLQRTREKEERRIRREEERKKLEEERARRKAEEEARKQREEEERRRHGSYTWRREHQLEKDRIRLHEMLELRQTKKYKGGTKPRGKNRVEQIRSYVFSFGQEMPKKLKEPVVHAMIDDMQGRVTSSEMFPSRFVYDETEQIEWVTSAKVRLEDGGIDDAEWEYVGEEEIVDLTVDPTVREEKEGDGEEDGKEEDQTERKMEEAEEEDERNNQDIALMDEMSDDSAEIHFAEYEQVLEDQKANEADNTTSSQHDQPDQTDPNEKPERPKPFCLFLNSKELTKTELSFNMSRRRNAKIRRNIERKKYADRLKLRKQFEKRTRKPRKLFSDENSGSEESSESEDDEEDPVKVDWEAYELRLAFEEQPQMEKDKIIPLFQNPKKPDESEAKSGPIDPASLLPIPAAADIDLAVDEYEEDVFRILLDEVALETFVESTNTYYVSEEEQATIDEERESLERRVMDLTDEQREQYHFQKRNMNLPLPISSFSALEHNGDTRPFLPSPVLVPPEFRATDPFAVNTQPGTDLFDYSQHKDAYIAFHSVAERILCEVNLRPSVERERPAEPTIAERDQILSRFKKALTTLDIPPTIQTVVTNQSIAALAEQLLFAFTPHAVAYRNSAFADPRLISEFLKRIAPKAESAQSAPNSSYLNALFPALVLFLYPPPNRDAFIAANGLGVVKWIVENLHSRSAMSQKGAAAHEMDPFFAEDVKLTSKDAKTEKSDSPFINRPTNKLLTWELVSVLSFDEKACTELNSPKLLELLRTELDSTQNLISVNSKMAHHRRMADKPNHYLSSQLIFLEHLLTILQNLFRYSTAADDKQNTTLFIRSLSRLTLTLNSAFPLKETKSPLVPEPFPFSVNYSVVRPDAYNVVRTFSELGVETRTNGEWEVLYSDEYVVTEQCFSEEVVVDQDTEMVRRKNLTVQTQPRSDFYLTLLACGLNFISFFSHITSALNAIVTFDRHYTEIISEGDITQNLMYCVQNINTPFKYVATNSKIKATLNMIAQYPSWLRARTPKLDQTEEQRGVQLDEARSLTMQIVGFMWSMLLNNKPPTRSFVSEMRKSSFFSHVLSHVKPLITVEHVQKYVDPNAPVLYSHEQNEEIRAEIQKAEMKDATHNYLFVHNTLFLLAIFAGSAIWTQLADNQPTTIVHSKSDEEKRKEDAIKAKEEDIRREAETTAKMIAFNTLSDLITSHFEQIQYFTALQQRSQQLVDSNRNSFSFSFLSYSGLLSAISIFSDLVNHERTAAVAITRPAYRVLTAYHIHILDTRATDGKLLIHEKCNEILLRITAVVANVMRSLTSDVLQQVYIRDYYPNVVMKGKPGLPKVRGEANTISAQNPQIAKLYEEFLSTERGDALVLTQRTLEDVIEIGKDAMKEDVIHILTHFSQKATQFAVLQYPTHRSIDEWKKSDTIPNDSIVSLFRVFSDASVLSSTHGLDQTSLGKSQLTMSSTNLGKSSTKDTAPRPSALPGDNDEVDLDNGRKISRLDRELNMFQRLDEIEPSVLVDATLRHDVSFRMISSLLLLLSFLLNKQEVKLVDSTQRTFDGLVKLNHRLSSYYLATLEFYLNHSPICFVRAKEEPQKKGFFSSSKKTPQEERQAELFDPANCTEVIQLLNIIERNIRYFVITISNAFPFDDPKLKKQVLRKKPSLQFTLLKLLQRYSRAFPQKGSSDYKKFMKDTEKLAHTSVGGQIADLLNDDGMDEGDDDGKERGQGEGGGLTEGAEIQKTEEEIKKEEDERDKKAMASLSRGPKEYGADGELAKDVCRTLVKILRDLGAREGFFSPMRSYLNNCRKLWPEEPSFQKLK
ncbi:hypothetical protein BLNAU_8341 [Blattamonas nauphoetae]|uniref:Uncharacterized protein n=1 Tax=Blattamonas nauphoetae TaxID=2049346 RepID=A0ABQ9XYX9_9EUKA|nr:hypothetical protein BLNAU_8341 [Blattamonas nauphoetae]